MAYRKSELEVMTNGRIKYLPDENGVYLPHEIVVFNKPTFVSPGWEKVKKRKSPVVGNFFIDERSEVADEILKSKSNDDENRRKSYMRAKNKLFDVLLSTTCFDCFVTLTLDASVIGDRSDYGTIIKKLGQWCDNRVRRNGLTYVFVPEHHKDGSIHFHGLINSEAVQTVRAINPYTGEPVNDDSGRPIYNITDYKLGFSTLIPLSGDNARIATAKYCYKYITKSGGIKVGGRYYLSGGALGRPKYDYVNVDYEMQEGHEVHICGTGVSVKKYKYKDSDFS